MNKIFSKLPAFLLTLFVGVLASSSALGQANIVIENVDPAGVGFNDTTAATPVGGNDGTTIGEQRLKAFQRAASIWGATLPGGPTITVRASWDSSLTCEATTGTLGSAGSIGIFRNFPNAPHTNTWYGSALANALAGSDLDPSTPEIRARFNPDIGTAANAETGATACLQNSHWYYGFDTIHVFGRINLVTVLLHEFAHGLGFQTFTSSSSGVQAGSGTARFPSVYDRFLLDNSTGKLWTDMTDAERMASAINTGNLVWNGPQVLGDATLLGSGKDAQGRPLMRAPNPVQGGSSVSHWDTSATPNQLMEPNITSGLPHSVRPPEDLTSSLLTDIGWCASNCPPPPPPPSPTPTPPEPANNHFVNAQLISGCSGSVAGTNLGANKEAGEPSHDPQGDAGGGSVWYQWTAPASTSVTITTAGSDYDTMLGVYTGTSVGSLTVIAKNDDVDLGVITTSTVTFTATAGTVYKIAVDGWGGERGNITLNWNQSNCSAAKIDQTISFLPLPNKTFGDAPFSITANASSGLPVSFSILSGPATISGNTITLINTGLVTVRASQAGDATYNAAPSVDQSFTVAKADQTINFGPLSDKTFGDPQFALTATSTSGFPVEYSVLSGPAVIGGNALSITGAGVVTIRASQPGNNTYNPAPNVDRSFTVAKANQTIAFNPLPNRTFGDAPFTIGASTTSGLVVSFSIVSGPATISGNTITITGVGVVTVRASQPGNENFNEAAVVDRAFTVDKANQTITFSSPGDKIFGNAPFNVNATASSGLAVSFSIVSGPATISGNTVTITGAGQVTVRASQGGDSNFNAANLDLTFTVAKANQTITFDSLPSKTFGDSPFPVTAVASSGLPVTFEIVSGPATISGNTLTITATGLVTVRATQTGNTNYNAAPFMDRAFNVVAANANISLSNLAHIYNGSAKFATVTTNPAGLSVTVTYNNGSVVSPTNAGEYNVTATINDPNFQGSTTGTLVINKATPVITWNNPANITFGTPVGNAQFNATSNVPGSFQYSPTPGTVLSIGTYQLSTVFIPNDVANYNTAGATVQLIVVEANWAITTLASSQVEIKTWKFEGKTSVYLKLAFPDAGYRVANWGQAVRTGNDFAADATVEKFSGATVQAIKTTAQIYDLGILADGNYTFSFKNSGIVVKMQAFMGSSTPPPANPIDTAREFVRWQYKDFLNREPDGPGWDHWTGEITQCSDPTKRNVGETEPQCVERKRANTSAAFFLSPEFQNTGYFVLRVYRGSLGRMPYFGGTGDNAKDEFTRDAAAVSAGIVVNDKLSPDVINANKQAFVNQFVTRSEFVAIYGGLSNEQYVHRLFLTTAVVPTADEKQGLIDRLNAGTETRASVLFKVVDGTTTITDGALVFNTPYGRAFYDQQFNPGFVQMEYFGYMKRDPDEGGYAFWLGKLNQFGNWVDAQMVLAFIASPEYRARFGQP